MQTCRQAMLALYCRAVGIGISGSDLVVSLTQLHYNLVLSSEVLSSKPLVSLTDITPQTFVWCE